MNNVIGLLVEINVVLGAAVLAAMLLRTPLRRYFGAEVGYAVWLLVPIAVLATQLPARMIVGVSPPSQALTATAPGTVWPVDSGLALLAVWFVGAPLLFLYFARAQMRFDAAMRAGKAGPAVAGVFRPKIVIPSAFTSQFLPEERDAVIAHEQAHLSRQDTRINAAAALLSCLCWFNPLIHIGVRLMRMDQEMACDAAVLACNPRMRRVYAEALLKTEMIGSPLPLGCYWPGGTEHPLMERMAMLKSAPPGIMRRVAGAGAILIASALAGWSAWAAQPPRIAVVSPAAAFVPSAPSEAPAKPTVHVTEMSSVRSVPMPVGHIRPDKARRPEATARIKAAVFPVKSAIDSNLESANGVRADREARLAAERIAREAVLKENAAQRQIALDAKFAQLKIERETVLGIKTAERTARLAREKAARDGAQALN